MVLVCRQGMGGLHGMRQWWQYAGGSLTADPLLDAVCHALLVHPGWLCLSKTESCKAEDALHEVAMPLGVCSGNYNHNSAGGHLGRLPQGGHP